jgi:hypothetical protein
MWSLEFQVMAGALVVLLFFHLVMFAPVALRQTPVEPDHELPVSVVICARNEARTLEVLLPVLIGPGTQSTFEVVVVNDRSEDDTWEVLQWMKPQYERLRPVNIQADEKFSYGKKIALGVGVRAAKYPHVLLTDADCLPDGQRLDQHHGGGFRKGKQHRDRTQSVCGAAGPYQRVGAVRRLHEGRPVHVLRHGRVPLHGSWSQPGLYQRGVLQRQTASRGTPPDERG